VLAGQEWDEGDRSSLVPSSSPKCPEPFHPNRPHTMRHPRIFGHRPADRLTLPTYSIFQAEILDQEVA
jgi:hypothetical protein